MPTKSPAAKAKARRRMRAYSQTHYQANKPYYLEKKKKALAKLVAWMADLKRKPCTDCKQTFNPWQMDWDHVGKKSFDIAERYRRMNRAAILEELTQCELVCANCHRQRTYERQLLR